MEVGLCRWLKGFCPLHLGKWEPLKGLKKRKARPAFSYKRISVVAVLRMNKIQHVRHLAQCMAHREHLVIITATIISDGNVIFVIITIIIIIIYFDVDAASDPLNTMRQMQ